jgi:hypothetical protein
MGLENEEWREKPGFYLAARDFCSRWTREAKKLLALFDTQETQLLAIVTQSSVGGEKL